MAKEASELLSLSLTGQTQSCLSQLGLNTIHNPPAQDLLALEAADQKLPLPYALVYLPLFVLLWIWTGTMRRGQRRARVTPTLGKSLTLKPTTLLDISFSIPFLCSNLDPTEKRERQAGRWAQPMTQGPSFYTLYFYLVFLTQRAHKMAPSLVKGISPIHTCWFDGGFSVSVEKSISIIWLLKCCA